jgi:hypothetical protein
LQARSNATSIFAKVLGAKLSAIIASHHFWKTTSSFNNIASKMSVQSRHWKRPIALFFEKSSSYIKERPLMLEESDGLSTRSSVRELHRENLDS